MSLTGTFLLIDTVIWVLFQQISKEGNLCSDSERSRSVSLVVQIMEGGFPGNPVGVHQSGIWGWSQGIDPGVWSGSGCRGECGRIVLACGGEVEVQAKRKAGEEREGKTGKWEQETLVRAVGVECFTRSLLCPVVSGRGRLLSVLLPGQPPASGGVHVWHSPQCDPSPRWQSSQQLLNPVRGGQPAAEASHSPRCVEERERERVSYWSWHLWREEERGRTERKGGVKEGESQGRDVGVERHTGGFL